MKQEYREAIFSVSMFVVGFFTANFLESLLGTEWSLFYQILVIVFGFGLLVLLAFLLVLILYITYLDVETKRRNDG
jgi:hypothetical protein